MKKLKVRIPKVLFWAITPVVVLVSFGLVYVTTSVNHKPHYATGVNEQINFQGRLLTAAGAVVPDGSYNVEFKIYQDGDGALGGGDETLKWTETRESGNKVLVKNGYFSVYLGSVTPFSTNVDWNQDTLWLSVNIGGTASPSYDGEMSPFNRLGATPYAINAKKIGGLEATNFVQLAQGTQTDSSSSNASIAINKTAGTANLLTLQRGGSDVLTIGNSGAVLFKNSTNSGNALQVQSASGADTMFNIDTSTRSGSGGNLVKIGNSTGTDADLTILQLDGTTADPTSNLAALDGGLFYDSSSDKVKIIENGVVKTLCNTTDAGCGAGGSTSLQNAYNNSSSPAEILLADGKNLVVTAADTTTDPSVIFNLQCTSSCGSNGKFAVQSGGTDVLTVSPSNGAVALRNTSNSASAFQVQNSGGSAVFGVDTSNFRVGIGTAAAAPGYILDVRAISGSSTAATEVLENVAFTDNGAVTSGTDETIGIRSVTTRTGASGSAITTAIGAQFQASGDTGGTSATYGVSSLAFGADANYGFYGGSLGVGATSSSLNVGVFGAVNSLIGAGGSVGSAYALQGSVGIDNGLTTYSFGTAAGLNVTTATIGLVGSTITTNYGIKVDTQTVGGSDYGIRVDTADTQTLWIAGNTNSTSASGGIAFGANRDVNLYRSGDDELKTDDNFIVGGDVIKAGVTKQTGLTGITDIYVYDTTKDSDGGAWTNSPTSQGLSWYTESKDDGPGDTCNISSDDRCDSSGFPKKAVIVSTTSAVYVFDMNDYKLFMKFTQNASGYALGVDTNNDPSSVFALNGVLYVGANGAAAGGMYAIDFTQDRLFNYNTTDRDQGDKNIANRNTAVAYATDSRTAMAIRHNAVNAVHGAVLYGSSSIETNGGPMNGATFIAAATDDSMSVINLSGQQTLDYGDNLTDQFSSVYVTKRGRLYGLNVTLSQAERYGTQANGTVGIDVAKVDQATPTDIWDEQAANTPNIANGTSAPTFTVGNPDALKVIERGSFADDAADTIYVGHTAGLTEIHDVNTASATVIGWAKNYNTARETAYMSGTPRGMFSFNETTGDLGDSTIRNSILEPKDAPTYGVNGVHGTALRFNGTSDYLCTDANNDTTCDVDSDFNVGTLSSHIEVWFKHATTISGTDVLVDNRFPTFGGAEGVGYTIEMNSSGQMVYGIQDTAATAAYDDSVTSTQAYNDGQWHHLVAVNTDTALCLYIDGKLTGSCDAALAATLTLDASQPLTIGADASGASGGNFWDGDIDDMYFAGNGATTSDTLSQAQIRRKFLEGRGALSHPSTRITDATTATTTTLGKTGETYTPNSFVGSIIEITSGTGAGQTRRVIANDATTLTVSPAFTVTPDTTSDYEVIPEQLYGGTDSVTSVGLNNTFFLGNNPALYIGTSDGSDGGGVTVFTGYANAFVSQVYHSNAAYSDSSSTAWSGTDADDIEAVSVESGIVALGSQANIFFEKDERYLEQDIDNILNQLSNIRGELIVDGLLATNSEVGSMGGADLAERYSSNQELAPGLIVSLDKTAAGTVQKTNGAYDKNTIGIVATQPAITIGPQEDNSYPIALSGRVPVKVVAHPGKSLQAGDRITSSDVPGYGMKATLAGRVVGTVLEDVPSEQFIACEGDIPAEYRCATAMVFVNLTDFGGQPVKVAMNDFENGGLVLPDSVLDPVAAWVDVQDETGVLTDKLQESDRIIRYLLARKQAVGDALESEILTDRVSSTEVNAVDINAKDIKASTITADKIRANQIEGLEVLTDKIDSLAASQNAPKSSTPTTEQPTTNSTSTSLTLKNVTVKMDLSVQGTLFAHGALKVEGPLDVLGQSVFHKLARFVDRVVFDKDVEFKGKIAVNNEDAAGYATIHKGQKQVKVTFSEPYEKAPIVTVTVKNGVFTTHTYKDLDEKSFTIILQEPASEDVEFAWTAIQVDDAKTTHIPLPKED